MQLHRDFARDDNHNRTVAPINPSGLYVARTADDVLRAAGEVFSDFGAKAPGGEKDINLSMIRSYIGTTKIARFSLDQAMRPSFSLRETEDQRFTLPILGRCRGRTRSGHVGSDGAGVYTHLPNEYFELETDGAYSWIGVTFKRERIARTFEAMTGAVAAGSIRFEFGLSKDTPERQTFTALTTMLLNDYTSGSSLLPLVSRAQEIEEILIRAILLAVPHSHSAVFSIPSSPAAPIQVKRAIDYIASNISGPICLDDLVRVSGVSERALHEAFKRFRGVSPMAFARNYRLEKIHQNLINPQDSDTVTEIASRWGVRHLGRFAKAYQERYGESPSFTFRRGSLAK